MATGLQFEPVTFEAYEAGKLSCAPLADLDAESLYTLRTTETRHLEQAGLLGHYATDITVRLVGKSSNPENPEVAYETFDPETGSPQNIDTRTADAQSQVYRNPQERSFGADVAYLLPPNETHDLDDEGRLAVYARIPLQAKKAKQLPPIELPRG